jgi:hypothetical protein
MRDAQVKQTSEKEEVYPTEIVFLVVLWRLRYKLSLRDVAEIFLERGFVFIHETVRDWEARFAPLFADQLRGKRHGQAGKSWYVDETTPLRLTEFAPAILPPSEQATTHLASSAPASGYSPPTTAASWKTGRFTGADFPLQPDGTLRCPAGQKLIPHERRREADGSLRVVYAASIRSCCSCPLRNQCQWNGSETRKPRQVSVLLHPLVVGNEPLLWYDWSRRHHRRACMQLLRHQRVDVQVQQGISANPELAPAPLSRPQRAHTRLSWPERLARNG